MFGRLGAVLGLVAVLAGAPVLADDTPYTVGHALGITTIPAPPERIVTLGWSGEDVVLALGHQPVAMTRYGSFPSGMFPWDEEKIMGTPPVLMSGDLDYEMIASLRPDLIVGVYSGIDERAYQRLSAIAPTVVYRSGPWAADWREQTVVIGEALGMADDAGRLIADTDALLAGYGTQYGDLKGKTFTFGTYFAGGGGVVVYLPDDPRVAALMGMGMRPSDGVMRFAERYPDETSISVPMEDIGQIEADVLIMWYGAGAREAAEAQPLFRTLDVVRRGSYVGLDDPVSVWSTSALSVLSIPYGFPEFLPRLAAAARASQ